MLFLAGPGGSPRSPPSWSAPNRQLQIVSMSSRLLYSTIRPKRAYVFLLFLAGPGVPGGPGDREAPQGPLKTQEKDYQ